VARGRSALLMARVSLAALVAACGGAQASPSVPAPTSAVTTTIAPSPTAPTSPPNASVAATAGASGLYPGQPRLDPAVQGTLKLDTFVRVTSEVLPASELPGGPPWRFDTGDPDPSTHPVIGFGRDLILVVLYGPVVINGVEWYLLASSGLDIDVPTGWAPIAGPSGPNVVAATDACPSQPRPELIAALQLTDGLPACYGRQDITMTGALTCELPPDESVVGASWLRSGSRCQFDAPFAIYALPADMTDGRYSVTGHFDDPEARLCTPADGGTSAYDRLRAILDCRRIFVATSVRSAA